MVNDNAQASASQNTPPRRRRRMRWWGWVLAIMGLLVCVTAGTWFGWGHVGQRRLDDLVAQIRSRGEPVERKDFAEPSVPDEQNALTLYQKARDKLFEPKGKYSQADVDGFGDILADLVRNGAFRRRHSAEVAAILEFSRESLALLGQAAEKAQVDFKIEYRSQATGLPSVERIMVLSEVAALAAIEAHEAGRDGEAFRQVRHAVALGRCMERGPILGLQMISMGCYDWVFPAVEQGLRDFRIGSEPAAQAGQVKDLIYDLLDTDSARRGWARGIMFERSTTYDAIEGVRRGQWTVWEFGDLRGPVQQSQSSRPWLLGPLLTWDEFTCLRSQTSLVEGAKQATYPAALRKMDNGLGSYQDVLVRKGEPGFKKLNPIGAILLPTIHIEGHYEHMALRRLAATALAMRLYEVEKGNSPAALGDLVAAGYLKEVPADPFSDKGEPVHYKTDPKQPVLYSIGKDGKDDGGTFKLNTDGDVDSPDVVFFLNGDRPTRKVKWQPIKTPETRGGAIK